MTNGDDPTRCSGGNVSPLFSCPGFLPAANRGHRVQLGCLSGSFSKATWGQPAAGVGLGPGERAGLLSPCCPPVASSCHMPIFHFYEHSICTQVPVTEKLMLIGKILLSPLKRAGHSRVNTADSSCLKQTVI